MKKLYYYPSAGKSGTYPNPYSVNYKNALGQYFEVLEADNRKPKGAIGWVVLKRAFQVDVNIYNWIENVSTFRGAFFQWVMVILAILVVKIRGKKIVWMFHNIHPHYGEDFYSSSIQWLLFHLSTLIVTHSKEAEEYAKKKAMVRVIYLCHPVETHHVESNDSVLAQDDIFIWGSIIPYKGIFEFISKSEIQYSDIKIRIIGSGSDKEYINKVKSSCNDHIVFEERRADFSEIASYCKKSRYVLFPYVGESVSSSGALIDTILFGGTPIGPNRGAFHDLSEQGLCITYDSFNQLLELLKSNRSINPQKVSVFIHENSWDSFVKKIHEKI
ncbi:MAG: hypothetical protein IKZ62_03815 [Prevotella sp.]|nr:hypothetical protein [Prevotella sp.]